MQLCFFPFLLATTAAMTTATPPTSIGMLLFPGFQAIDVMGPLDILNLLSLSHKNLSLSILSRTLSPVSTASPLHGTTTFGESIVPTHTLTSPPDDLEVLFVPGGLGILNAAPGTLDVEMEFIRTVYPKLRYVIGVCTGAALLANAGVLEGKRATGNKGSWAWMRQQGGGEVHWVAHARWVEDGKAWTTSGVSAGIDGTYAWVAKVYGEEAAQSVSVSSEYVRQLDWRKDPWAEYYNLTDTCE
ncbi:DJ-1/PfpI family protein [Geopyxis carbonaria]|nr:DJ-1/PfpI family protein [Geopyxis carbonaria]